MLDKASKDLDVNMAGMQFSEQRTADGQLHSPRAVLRTTREDLNGARCLHQKIRNTLPLADTGALKTLAAVRAARTAR